MGMKEYIVQAIEQETIDSFDAHNAPEIVRCHECIRRGTYNCPIYVGGNADHGSPDDWFCADGERREVE